MRSLGTLATQTASSIPLLVVASLVVLLALRLTLVLTPYKDGYRLTTSSATGELVIRESHDERRAE